LPIRGSLLSMRIHTLSLRAALTVIATVTLGLTAAPLADATTTTTSYAVPSVVAAIPSCSLSSLPPEASDTLDLIHSGGPFPYSQDGTVFQNREGILPSESTGYYHEYTVKTPGSPDRGARRLIGGGSPVTDPQYVYYTGDHYTSFCKVTS
jgi:ribonuclease T1